MLLRPLRNNGEEDVLLVYDPCTWKSEPTCSPTNNRCLRERVRICASVELVLGALLVPDNQVGDDCSNVTPISLNGSISYTILPIPETEETDPQQIAPQMTRNSVQKAPAGNTTSQARKHSRTQMSSKRRPWSFPRTH